MDKLRSKAAGRSQGEVRVSGAKNAALPILCAALLTAEAAARSTNVPHLRDVRTMAKLLGADGRARSSATATRIDAAREARSTEPPRPTSW